MYLKDKIKKIIEDYSNDPVEIMKEVLLKECPEISKISCLKDGSDDLIRVYVGTKEIVCIEARISRILSNFVED